MTRWPLSASPYLGERGPRVRVGRRVDQDLVVWRQGPAVEQRRPRVPAAVVDIRCPDPAQGRPDRSHRCPVRRSAGLPSPGHCRESGHRGSSCRHPCTATPVWGSTLGEAGARRAVPCSPRGTLPSSRRGERERRHVLRRRKAVPVSRRSVAQRCDEGRRVLGESVRPTRSRRSAVKAAARSSPASPMPTDSRPPTCGVSSQGLLDIAAARPGNGSRPSAANVGRRGFGRCSYST